MNYSFLKSDSFIYIKLYHFFLCFSMTKLVYPQTNIANIASYFLVIFIFYFTCMYILFLIIFMIKYIIMPKQKSVKQRSVFNIIVYNFMLESKRSFTHSLASSCGLKPFAPGINFILLFMLTISILSLLSFY